MKQAICFLLLAAFILPANAARLCREGKSYDRENCKEVRERADGTVEIHPAGKSYDYDNTWVVDGDRMYKKGKSYDHENSYTIRKRPDGTTEIYPSGKSYDHDNTWTIRDDKIYKKGKSYDSNSTYKRYD